MGYFIHRPFMGRLRMGAFAAVCVAVFSAVIAGEPAGDDKPAVVAAFSFANVDERAKALAAGAYAAPAAQVPDFLRNLSLEQWRNLRYRPEEPLWGDGGENRPSPQLLLPGSVFNQIAAINIIDENGVAEVPYSPERIESRDKALVARLQETPLGFAGFRFGSDGVKGDFETMGLIGASHFQFSGRNARIGVFARPIAIDTALSSGEQFCHFREFWLRRPASDDATLLLYALMDSPGMTGAFEFSIAPGASAVVDVRASFHTRSGSAAPTKLGIAPISGMFLFSERDGGRADDYRPEVHNCDGLLIADDAGWQWTPLKNPERLALGSFPRENPRGFGLLQRDVNFDHYQDLAKRFDLCSSVWVEPKGDWGAGRIELVEIPGSKDYHSNIVAYWIPDARPVEPTAQNGKNGKNGKNGQPQTFELEYRLYWTPPGTQLHELGTVRDTRMERSGEDKSVTLVIDFEGGELGALPADTGLTSVVEVAKEATLVDKHLMKNEATGGWRLTLKIIPPHGGMLDSLLAAREGPPQLPVSAYLKKGENLTEALTETWRCNLTP